MYPLFPLITTSASPSEKLRISYYIVYDPTQQLGENTLRVYELRGRRYFETSENWLE